MLGLSRDFLQSLAVLLNLTTGGDFHGFCPQNKTFIWKIWCFTEYFTELDSLAATCQKTFELHKNLIAMQTEIYNNLHNMQNILLVSSPRYFGLSSWNHSIMIPISKSYCWVNIWPPHANQFIWAGVYFTQMAEKTYLL